MKSKDIIKIVFGNNPRYDSQFIFNINAWSEQYDNNPENFPSLIPTLDLTDFINFKYDRFITTCNILYNNDKRVTIKEEPEIFKIEKNEDEFKRPKIKNLTNYETEFEELKNKLIKNELFCFDGFTYNLIRSQFSKEVTINLFTSLLEIFRIAQFMPTTYPNRITETYLKGEDQNKMFRMLSFYNCVTEVRHNCFSFNIDVGNRNFLSKAEFMNIINKHFSDTVFTPSMIVRKIYFGKRCSSELVRIYLLYLRSLNLIGIMVSTELEISRFVLIK